MSSNANEVMNRLKRFVEVAPRNVGNALQSEMQEIVKATQSRMAKKSGDMADSVSALPVSINGLLVSTGVGVGSHHAAAQEFGTGTVRPHPSFRPSIRESQDRTPGKIAGALKKD